jgi:hypothetical protein
MTCDSKSLAMVLLLVAGLAASAQAALLGHYQFEGNANDSATADGAQDGTITGAANAAGLVGSGALNFNGSTDFVNAGSNFTLNTSAVTITTWFKADTVNTTAGQGNSLVQMPINGGAGLNASAAGIDLSAGKFQVGGRSQVADSFAGAVISSYTLEVGHVYFAAGVLKYSAGSGADRVQAYLYDATTDVWRTQLTATTAGTFGATTNTAGDLGMYVGKRGDSLRYFDGIIDDVRIYNEALSGATIMASVPEPGTAALFLPAAILALRRRRSRR